MNLLIKIQRFWWKKSGSVTWEVTVFSPLKGSLSHTSTEEKNGEEEIDMKKKKGGGGKLGSFYTK